MTPGIFADPLKLQLLASDLERIARSSGPSPGDLAHAPVLIDWHLGWQRVPVLVGVVAGHPELPAGHVVGTSQLYSLDLEEGRWARTMNRWYALSSGVNLHG